MSLLQHQQFYQTVQAAQKPLIVFKKDHSGDTIAASLALAQLLKKIGRPAEIICPDFKLPNAFSFLPEAKQIQGQTNNLKKFIISLNISQKQNPQIEHHVEGDRLHIHVNPEQGAFSKQDVTINDAHYHHDLIITVNTTDLEALDKLYHENTDFFYNAPVINIDHSAENEHYGHLNLINITATSVSEIVYDLIEQIDPNLLDEAMATCLLTGMIEKTNSFKVPAVTPKSLNIASRLMTAGAQRDSIIKNLYQTKTVNALRLWGRALLNLKTDETQKIAWAEIAEHDFIETNAKADDLYGVIGELIANIPTVELTALFFSKNEQTYCLIKSEKDVNLFGHFQEHRPSGNKSLIQFKLTSPPQTIIEKLQQLI